MATIYLDVDDEITSAAARIRGSKDVKVALVLPSGSRIATSRINFKLLLREAQEHSRRVVIVTPDKSARALAASAGLAVFASVRDYELDAEDRPRGEPGAAGRGAAGRAASGSATTEGSGDDSTPIDGEAGAGPAIAQARPLSEAEMAARGEPGSAAGEGQERLRDGAHARSGDAGARSGDARRRDAMVRAAAAGSTGRSATAATIGRARGGRRGLIVALVVAAFVVVAASVAAYLILPTARVVVTLRTVAVGPLDLTVHADPQATTPDADELVVPATRLDLPLSASGTFPATGRRVAESSATGSLTWTNCDPTRSYSIPKGAIARTSGGTGFATSESIFLPVATLNTAVNPPQIGCQSRTVTATATKAGPGSNVAAGTVTVVPGSLNSVVVLVRNPAAMSGGSHKEFPKVVQKDVDAAMAALSTQLDEQLAAAAAAPAGLPAGTTVFPETAARGDAVPGLDPATLVDTEVPTFDLSVTASGSVTVVDPSPLHDIGARRLAALVPAGSDVVAGSTSITVGQGTVADGIILFSIAASEESVPRVDPAALREQVKGKTPDQVRALVGSLGDVTITLWPDWVRTVTGLDARLEFSMTGPDTALPGSSPGPSGGIPGASASPAASGPGGSPSPGASGATSPAPSGPAESVPPEQSGSPAASGSPPSSTAPTASPAPSASTP